MPPTLYVLMLCLANIGLSQLSSFPNPERLETDFVSKVTLNTICYNNETISFRDIVINELFVDPTGSAPPDPQVLPSLSSDEFIELFNTTSQPIDISDFDMAGGRINSFILPAHGHVILTANSNIADFEPFGAVVGVSSWNNLLNGGETLVLKDKEGSVLDSITYDRDWYNDASKSNGAWSLEQINPYTSCNNVNNWSASVDPRGASPGAQNSIFDDTPDQEAPEVVDLEVISDQQLRINLNEPMDLTSLLVENLEVSNGLVISDLTIENDFGTSLLIDLSNPFDLGVEHEITLSDLADCSGNPMEQMTFPFFLAATPGFEELIITEIMADPSPSLGLPESEYLEIYNRSDLILSLDGIALSDNTGSTTLQEGIIYPDEYLILAPGSQADTFTQFGPTMEVSGWRNLNATSDLISLSIDNDLIHEVLYNDSWYRSDEKSSGGYSLEMIDLDYPCYESLNWNASSDMIGGTPGRINSVRDNNPDIIGPSLVSAFATSDHQIELIFNEKLSTNHVSINNFDISPALQIFELTINPNKRAMTLQTNQLQENTVYEITADNIADCSGNLILSTHKSIQLIVPASADSLDLVINEVLFDPLVGGVRFVELFNKSSNYLNLNGWSLKGSGDPKTLTEANNIMAPGTFKVITPDTTILKNHYPNAVSASLIQANKFPTLSSTEGPVNLIDQANNIIDSVYYSEAYHSPLISDNEGVSLERIQHEFSSTDPNNWISASSTENFATPGYINSQFNRAEGIESAITVSPKVIAPDQPGQANFTTLNYRFKRAGFVMTIGIYHPLGNLVKRVTENTLTGTNGFFRWDGVNERGEKVRVGYYLIFFEITSPEGMVTVHKESVAIGSRL